MYIDEVRLCSDINITINYVYFIITKGKTPLHDARVRDEENSEYIALRFS